MGDAAQLIVPTSHEEMYRSILIDELLKNGFAHDQLDEMTTEELHDKSNEIHSKRSDIWNS